MAADHHSTLAVADDRLEQLDREVGAGLKPMKSPALPHDQPLIGPNPKRPARAEVESGHGSAGQAEGRAWLEDSKVMPVEADQASEGPDPQEAIIVFDDRVGRTLGETFSNVEDLLDVFVGPNSEGLVGQGVSGAQRQQGAGDRGDAPLQRVPFLSSCSTSLATSLRVSKTPKPLVAVAKNSGRCR